jgi:hypothetical protein
VAGIATADPARMRVKSTTVEARRRDDLEFVTTRWYAGSLYNILPRRSGSVRSKCNPSVLYSSVEVRTKLVVNEKWALHHAVRRSSSQKCRGRPPARSHEIHVWP